MKKLFLSIVVFTLSNIALNVHSNQLSDNQEYLVAHGVKTETTGDATDIQGYDEYYQIYRDQLNMDMDAVFARFAKEDLEKYIGYKVVGVSIVGEFGQTNVDFLLNISCNQTWGDNIKMSSKNVAIAKGKEAKSSIHGMKIYTWNDIMFETPYTIPQKKENAEEGDPEDFQDLYAGYWIKNAEGKIVMKNLLIGQFYSNATEDGMHTEPGTYIQQTGASTKIPTIAGLFPRLLPVKLILEKPKVSNINATTTSHDAIEVARYTVDGRRIYLPVRGINIVKMSDQTTRKIIMGK